LLTRRACLRSELLIFLFCAHALSLILLPSLLIF
jgi:hypothetical protein